MKVTIVGTGYVGLVTGTGLANLGNDVICLDIDKEKIENLKKGIIPIYEPGLEELYLRNMKQRRLIFTTNTKSAVEKSDIIFLAVGTPCNEKCEADLRYVDDVAKSIGRFMNSYKVIVNKSTVPVGTADRVKKMIKEFQTGKYSFDVVSNPEFLREGAAIKDFENPDRIIVGVESTKAQGCMEELYSSVVRTGRPIMFTDVKSAELIKYASNSMLATRISFMNQLSHLCEKTGADIKEVAKGMGFDKRIGPRFLQAGIGYGGSCFPKDVLALVATLKENGCEAGLFEQVHEINEHQKTTVVEKLTSLMDVKDKTIGIWGVAFKPKTDDVREAPSVKIIRMLQRLGAKIHAFDPVAADNAKKVLKNVSFFKTPYETIKNCDALIIVTEWDVFRSLDKEAIKVLMNKPIIIDGRNIYDPAEMKKMGFTYKGVGR